MRVQLINTPYLDVYGSLRKIAAVYFPLGLGYLASVLEENGLDQIDLFDPEAERADMSEIAEKIKKVKADVIGLSCVTASYPTAKKISKIVKKVNPEAVLVFGGVHVSALPRETLEDCPEIDLLVLGEGEYTFLKICQQVAKGLTDFNFSGTAFRRGSKIIVKPYSDFISDLDQIPFPARHLVNLDNYCVPPHMNFGKKSATLISSRGCPARCTFCASRTVAGSKFRAHSADYVVSEIKHLQEKYGVDHYIFEDDSFTISKRRVEDICRKLLKLEKAVTWSCFGRVNSIDGDLLKLMKKAGCLLIGYGVEAGNDKVRQLIKKGISKDQCRRAFQLSHKAGMKTQGFFMIGNPGETEETIKETIDFAIELDPTLAFFSPLVPYPGTEIYKDCLKFSLNPSNNWSTYSAFGDNLALSLHQLPLGKLKNYCSLANKKFYLRLSYLLRRIINLSSVSEIKDLTYGGLTLLAKVLKEND